MCMWLENDTLFYAIGNDKKICRHFFLKKELSEPSDAQAILDWPNAEPHHL